MSRNKKIFINEDGERMVEITVTPQFIHRLAFDFDFESTLRNMPAKGEDEFKIELHNDLVLAGGVNNMEGALKTLEKYLEDKNMINHPSVLRDKSYERTRKNKVYTMDTEFKKVDKNAIPKTVLISEK